MSDGRVTTRFYVFGRRKSTGAIGCDCSNTGEDCFDQMSPIIKWLPPTQLCTYAERLQGRAKSFSSPSSNSAGVATKRMKASSSARTARRATRSFSRSSRARQYFVRSPRK
jgi:hypothetical protein